MTCGGDVKEKTIQDCDPNLASFFKIKIDKYLTKGRNRGMMITSLRNKRALFRRSESEDAVQRSGFFLTVIHEDIHISRTIIFIF